MTTKISLSPEQIEDILSFLSPNKYIPTDSGHSIIEKTKKEFVAQLKKIEIYPHLIPDLKKNLEKMYLDSLIQPGESVGIITAQCIGERQTQQNLNSLDWNEKIIVIENGNTKVTEIGRYIDNLIELSDKKSIEKIPENRTEYLGVLDKKIYIPSCDKNGMTDWYRVEAVTRHLPVGDLVKVYTQSGRTVVATQAKSFLVWNGTTFEGKNGSDIAVGDFLPTTKKLKPPVSQTHVNLAHYFPELFNPEQEDTFDPIIKLDSNFGSILGYAMSVNCTTTEFSELSKIYPITSHKGEKYIVSNTFRDKWCKRGYEAVVNSIPDWVYTAPMEFIEAFLTAYFSADSTTTSDNIIATSYSEEFLHGICVLLSYIDTIPVIKSLQYNRNKLPSYSLIFQKYDYETGVDIYFDKVVKIERVQSSTEFVYDFTVEKTRNFQIFNGINVADTFHKAGSSDKQPVVSKFSDLLNVTTKPKSPSYMVYFNTGNKTVQELRKTVNHSIVQLTCKKITVSVEICIDKKEEPWYPLYYALTGNDEENLTYTDCISLKINMDILYEYKLTLKKICQVIEKEYTDVKCIYSPDCYGKINIYVDTSKIDLEQEQLTFITQDNYREVYLEEVVLPVINGIIVCGIPGIMAMYFLKDDKTGEWIVETENSREKVQKGLSQERRYKDLLTLPIVDMTRTVSNKVWDIYYTFGIEATRQYMIEEFSKIMEGINLCHVMLLVDKMTYMGVLSSISRYTMRHEDSGALSKASFEETLDVLTMAGVYGQDEPTKGVSSAIICSKRARIGTGLCDLEVDLQKLP